MRSRFDASAARISSNQSSDRVIAASPANAPKCPTAPDSAERGTANLPGLPLITNAHLSPARLKALDADEMANPTSRAVADTARNEVKSTPGMVSGAQIS